MRSFTKSEELLKRAQYSIPLGSQTFSKSRTQFPVGVSPLFLERGDGCHVWDVDGNRYTDFISSLCAITLGYQDKHVTDAVRDQLESGVILSLPHRLETEVAELLCDMVPCAEMVRFGKNGSDATAGAIRLARAFTSRDHVAVCGYHGWQDWYIGSTARSLGVPAATRELTHSFAFNDIASLEKLFTDYPGQIAAVIMEVMNVEWPADGYLQDVKKVCEREGAVLIFDETITGFRYANGGAQEYFGVTPDLATFGKGLANGFPLSALAGRRDIMMLMEDIFFSFTFGGEMLSLAAAKATLEKLKREPVIETITARGQQLVEGLKDIITEHQLGERFQVKGHPSWSFLIINEADGTNSFEIKTLLMQEFHQAEILSFGAHNINYAHEEKDIAYLLSVYRRLLPMIAAHIANGTVLDALRCDPLVPLFKVR